MKILFQYFAGGGGSLSNFTLLLRALAKAYPNDKIDVVCSKFVDMLSLEGLANVEIVPYSSTGGMEIQRARLGFGGLMRIAHQRKADIVWCLNLGSYVRREIPQVLSVNNAHQVYPWAISRYHPRSSLRVAILRWFSRLSIRASDGVIVQTSMMGHYLQKLSPPRSRLCVVPKAVETADDVAPRRMPEVVAARLESGLTRDAFTYLYVSTYFPHKNHKTIVDAFVKIADAGHRIRAIMTIEDRELEDLGGEAARRLMKSGHLVPIGWLSKEYLRSLYDAADACLMPSILESLSSAHLEAMKWGKPQITADLPYARDLCQDAAIYVQADDAGAWAHAILSLARDRARRDLLAASGIERVKFFPSTWSESAERVHAFLELIVEERLAQRFKRSDRVSQLRPTG